MPIEQKRIEAAMRAYLASPSTLEARAMVTGILNSAFPELASDPPTGWVAPVVATKAMESAMEMEVYQSAAWQAARDAHIKEQGE